MQIALEEARAAGARGEVPVGCVIVRDNKVVARAGNRALIERDPTAHAELIAIRAAAAELGSERLTGATLDRLTHRCHILEATGESYRLQDARRRKGGGKRST